MRILQVIHGFLPQFRGGTELYLLGHARELRRLGHDVHIVTGTTDSAPEAHIEDYHFDDFPVKRIVLSGSYLEHWTRSFSPEASRLFAQAVQDIQPDIVHIQHWYRLSRSLIETCHRMSIPAVCTLHDLWTTCPRIFRIREESYCDRPLSGESCTSCVPRFPWMQDEDTHAAIELFREDFVNELALAHRIIVPSEAHGEVIRDVTDLDTDKVQVIPHGTIVGLQKDRTKTARSSRPKKGGFFKRKAPIRLGVWCHLFHMKGVHLILDALQTLRDKRRFELHVWGKVTEPQYKKRLESVADDLDITWHGAFVPEDLRKVELDLAIIPSLCSESFSFVLDEAFDMGLPAVVPRRGALEERVGAAGTTFIAEDANDLARVFKTLLKKPELINMWRESIPELTTMAWHAKEVEFIYKDVLKNASRISLQGDPTLPWRRLEFQTATARASEAMMFGYLGHIKRETGRGDHYEGEMRKLMAEKEEWAKRLNEAESGKDVLARQASESGAMLESLAQEIDALRAALGAVDTDGATVGPRDVAVPNLESHVPGLGSLEDVVETNNSIVASYGAALKERFASLRDLQNQVEAKASEQEHLVRLERDLKLKEASIAFLAREVLVLRDAILSTDSDLPEADAPAGVDLPGLGPCDETKAENRRVVKARLQMTEDSEKESKTLRQAIQFLAAELVAFRSMVAHIFDDEQPYVASPEPEETEYSIPELGLAQDVKQVNDDMLDALADGFANLKEQLDLSHRDNQKAHEEFALQIEEQAKQYDQVIDQRSEELQSRVQEVAGEFEARIGELVTNYDQRLEEQAATYEKRIADLVESQSSQLDGHAQQLEAQLASQAEGYEAQLQGRDAFVAKLGELMDAVRRALINIQSGDDLPERIEGLDVFDQHVPGLGDLQTIADVNDGLLRELREAWVRQGQLREPDAVEDPPESDTDQ